MPYTIAIVEDDADQRQNYADALSRRGYAIKTYSSRDEALTAFKDYLPDLAILDIVLGNEIDGGFDLCRELLTMSPGLPIIFLTDRVDEIDQVSGLRLGAWDYQTKPVSLPFLAEKIAALFRIIEQRDKTTVQETLIRRDKLLISEEAMEARWDNHLLELTLTEFRLILALARRPGIVITYDQMMQATLQSVVTRNTINTHVMNLRKKIFIYDPEFDSIHSEYGVGYRWVKTTP